MSDLIVCWWLDSNRVPLALERLVYQLSQNHFPDKRDIFVVKVFIFVLLMHAKYFSNVVPNVIDT